MTSHKMVNPNTGIWWIPLAGLTSGSSPSAAQITAGTRISGAVTTGYSLGFKDSDVDKSKTVEDEGNVDTPTLKNYEGKISLFKDDISVPSLAAPVLSAPTTATTGGTLAAATYYYKATYTNANGETVGSNEISQITTGTTSTVSFTIGAAPAGATGTKIYRGTAAGVENVVIATLGIVTSYTDTGAAGTASTVPATNTTGSLTTIFTTAVNLFLVPYVEGWIVTRYGKKASVAVAAGDKVSTLRFKNDYPMTVESAAGAPILVEVGFLPQGEAYPNVVCVA
jgi:hypothetical protein